MMLAILSLLCLHSTNICTHYNTLSFISFQHYVHSISVANMFSFPIECITQRFSLSNWEKYPYRSDWEKLSRENLKIGKNRVVKSLNWENRVVKFGSY